MRHGKKINHLGRKTAHRHALMSNLACSLIQKKRITTTVAKAKALRKFVEPLLTRSKDNSTPSRRLVMSYLQDKETIKTLFNEVAGRIAERKGGYTRIVKLGETRLGDGSEMCLMELVDYNDTYKKDGAAKKAKTRRSRRSSKAEKQEAAGAESAAANAEKA